MSTKEKVLAFLTSTNRWHSKKDIAKNCQTTVDSLYSVLWSLENSGEVIARKVPDTNNTRNGYHNCEYKIKGGLTVLNVDNVFSCVDYLFKLT